MKPLAGWPVAVAPLIMLGSSPAAAQDWATLGAGPARASWAAAAPLSIDTARRVIASDQSGQPIVFEGQSTVVSRGDRVYALGRSAALSRLFCIDAITGQTLWGAPVLGAVLESWASPSVYAAGGVILVASGRYLTAIDAITGVQRWQTLLDRNTAGATPAIRDDAPGSNRAFITDYDGFGGSGKLYCINIDPFTPQNPYAPGHIVWSVTLGATSANSPAYESGVVYVASVSDASGAAPGQIRAFDASTTTPPPPLWTFTNIAGYGFFGGVGVSAGSVYAASYAFAGGQFAANVVKVDAAGGGLRWSAACNRTDAVPVVLPDGSVVVSGGIRGFGSTPSIQKFRDDGTSATLLWDSAVHSWIDTNGNQQMDPGEYLDIGGWTMQPAASMRGGVPVLFAGVLPAGPSTSGACTALYELDLDRSPAETGFVRQSFIGAGSSPAIASGGVYTLGPGGLYALGAAPCAANCDGSSAPPVLTANDFVCFVNLYAAGSWRANCDDSTGTPALTANDFACFLNRYAGGCP